MKKIILLITVFIGCLRIGYAQPGKLDPSFGNNGIVSSTFGSLTFYRSTALQSDGKIIVGGSVLACYNTDGSVDTTFATNGYQTPEFRIQGIAIQSDGKIVAAGTSAGDFALTRYNSDGTLDTSFSEDGKQTTDFGDNDAAFSVVIQSDGKIVVAGSSVGNPERGVSLARYNIDGTLDTTFSDDGKQTTARNTRKRIIQLVLQPYKLTEKLLWLSL